MTFFQIQMTTVAMFSIFIFFTVPCIMCSLDRRQFLKDLLQNYEQELHPSEDLLNDVDIEIQYQLFTIKSLNEVRQYLEASVNLVVTWNDIFMTWNASASGPPKHITLSTESIWMPSLVIFNAKDDSRYIGSGGQVVITSKGKVVWETHALLKTACMVDITKFPFDRQTCQVVIGPSRRKYGPFKLHTAADYNFLQFYRESNEWELENIKFHKEDFNGSIMINEHLFKGNLIVTLQLRRKYLFHIIKSVIPPISLSIMNCFVFRLPVASGERLTMALSVLLSYTIYLSFINESLPANSNTICIFSIYLTSMLLLSIGIVIATSKSMALYHETDIKKIPWIIFQIIRCQDGKVANFVSANDSPGSKVSSAFDKVAFVLFFCVNGIVTLVCFTKMVS